MKGVIAATGIAGLAAGLSFKPTRAVLGRVLPSPGEGPSENAQRTGFFRLDIHTFTSGGARYVGRVAAKGDPGYAATSLMLGEAAMCLARDELPDRGGVLTPATAMGLVLIERLRIAGMTLSVT